MTLAFEGHAALWDRVDRAGDVMRRGAFGGPRAVPLLWQHRGRPVGVAEVREDDAGLFVAGRIEAAGVAELVRRRALDGLSVGYRPVRVSQGVWRELGAVALIEVSLVAVPMQRDARVTRVF